MTYFHIRATSHTPNLLEWMMLLYKTKGSQKGQSDIRMPCYPTPSYHYDSISFCLCLAGLSKKNLATVGKLDS